MRVLIVEDDMTLAANIGEYLEQDGHEADYASDGHMAVSLIASQAYDALVLDLRLPRLDGLTVCRRLRDADVTVPILMLTARHGLDDRIAGFEAGADDYLAKPFSLRELVLRLQAITRRERRTTASCLRVGALTLDHHNRIVRYGDTVIELTPIAFAILAVMMRAAPRPVPRAEFEREIWNDQPPGSDAALRGHIHRLREEIQGVAGQPMIHTVQGVGYRVVDAS